MDIPNFQELIVVASTAAVFVGGLFVHYFNARAKALALSQSTLREDYETTATYIKEQLAEVREENHSLRKKLLSYEQQMIGLRQRLSEKDIEYAQLKQEYSQLKQEYDQVMQRLNEIDK